MPIYGADTIAAYNADNEESLPPHVFAIARDAYRALLRSGTSQSILVTGESGAGKTETTKHIIRYFAWVSRQQSRNRRRRHHAGESGGRFDDDDDNDDDGDDNDSGDDSGDDSVDGDERSVQRFVLQSTPLLEAFGNARTAKNDNSSRFGKFIRILFEGATGAMQGAAVTTYLLEKSRVVLQAPGERNYHIFYQLMAGCADVADMLLVDPATGDLHPFRYLNGELPTVQDARAFARTQHALRTVDVSVTEQRLVFRVLAGLLHLGEVHFGGGGGGGGAGRRAGDRAVTISNPEAVASAAALLDVKEDVLERTLLWRMVVLPDEWVATPIVSAAACAANRDTLAKAVYARLFDWILGRVNEAMGGWQKASTSESEQGNPGGLLHIGVLDIYGFEVFEHNSFEQVCWIVACWEVLLAAGWAGCGGGVTENRGMGVTGMTWCGDGKRMTLAL